MGLFNYFNETKAELKHVNWPTRQQAVFFTIAIVLISTAIAVFLGFFDYVFSQAVQKIIS